VADWQSRMRSTLENLLMGVGTMHTINERTILKIIQKMNDRLSSFMMNQATPHLGAHSCLINNERSNHCGKLRIGMKLTAEWMTSTRISR
jgi:hypothetical protein